MGGMVGIAWKPHGQAEGRAHSITSLFSSEKQQNSGLALHLDKQGLSQSPPPASECQKSVTVYLEVTWEQWLDSCLEPRLVLFSHTCHFGDAPWQQRDRTEQRSEPGEGELGQALTVGSRKWAHPPSRGGKPGAGVLWCFHNPGMNLGGGKNSLFSGATWPGALQPVWCPQLLKMICCPRQKEESPTLDKWLDLVSRAQSAG